jgi:hypothetical protein
LRTKKGIALAAILVISGLLLCLITVGLKLGSEGVLFVSGVHRRNVALAAAEAGVYEAMAALENDKNFSGAVEGTLATTGATYTVTVENSIFSERKASVTSTGEFGRTRRTLRAELEPDSGGFDGISLAGKVYVFDQAYVNAIASSDSPIARPGNAHTNYQNATAPSFVGGDFDSDGTVPRLHATGSLSAQGSFDPNLVRTARSEQTDVTQPVYRLDPVAMASGSFSNLAPSALTGGTLTGNTEVTGDVEVAGKLIVPKGVKLVINGSAKFLGGLSGDGEVVVNGDVLMRTDSVYDPAIEEGIKLYAKESVFVTHPKTKIDEDGIDGGEFNVVGDFFAQMPLQTPTELSTNIPVTAPRGGDFFQWYDNQVDSPDGEFDLWYNGDGTDIYPGLSEETKAWLEISRPIQGQIAAWSAGS